MITLHHLNNSRSQRVLWLLEELGIDYDIERYQRNPETQLAPDALKKIHPLGKSPIITDDSNTVAESAVIIQYLIRRYGKTKPNDITAPEVDSEAFNQMEYWLHYAEGSLMPYLVMTLVFNKVRDTKVPFFIKPITKGIADKVTQSFISPNVKNNLRFIENHLAKNTWFAGEHLTAADFQMIFPLEAAINRSGLAKELPAICAYVNRIHARPAYKAGIEKGGEYDYA